MATYTYRLPWPPSVNDYWGTRVIKVNGRMTPVKYLTKRAKDFRDEVIDWIALGRERGNPEFLHEVLESRLAVHIELTAPTRRRCDVDNFCKSTLDALMHAGVFKDDSQIDELRVKRLHVEAPGACDVTITEL